MSPFSAFGVASTHDGAMFEDARRMYAIGLAGYGAPPRVPACPRTVSRCRCPLDCSASVRLRAAAGVPRLWGSICRRLGGALLCRPPESLVATSRPTLSPGIAVPRALRRSSCSSFTIPKVRARVGVTTVVRGSAAETGCSAVLKMCVCVCSCVRVCVCV